MNTLEATVFVKSSSNLLRIIILTISPSSSNMGHVGSKTRSADQTIEKPCEHSRSHSFGPNFIKLPQNDHLYNISVKLSNMGHVGSKTRSADQTIEKPCEHSRGHSFGSNFIKLYHGSCRVKN